MSAPEEITRDQSDGFQPTPRFVIRRRLGEGAVGVVYLAHDLERKQDVALKALRRTDALALYRFKQEFRSLADVAHPNLAGLYELMSKGDEWFFTMELVDGVDFLSYVRPGVVLAAPGTEIVRDTIVDRALLTTDRGDDSVRPMRAMTTDKHGVPHISYPLDEDRLRRSLIQLARGIVALHEAGKLHRDIKPTNVLVTRDHRVVLLDFGLVTELPLGGLELGGRRHVCGTAGYMSPEQAGAGVLSPASDWYSVGVILYEALTGTLPFLGTVDQVLKDKQASEPKPARMLAKHVALDLDRLCTELLKREPSERPDGRAILQSLGEKAVDDLMHEVSTSSHSSPVPLFAHPFVGRDVQLASLRDAFEATKRGRAVALVVSGESGMGKTALVRRFLDQLIEKNEATVLSGRCYERESVPYKALDSLIDALAGHLMEKSDDALAQLITKDAPALARLFPVLTRVRAISRAMTKHAGARDPQELRRRAFAALRALFGSLALEKPLVLSIDDLQWGDRDSGALLADVLRPPGAPPILLLASHRPIGEETSPLLSQLRGVGQDSRLTMNTTEFREVIVGALTDHEARALAYELLSSDAKDEHGQLPSSIAAFAARQAEAIAREAGGNPFFVAELVRYLQATGDNEPTRTKEITLDEVLQARISRLPSEAGRLLSMVAVAGRPIELSVARLAAQVDDDDKIVIPLLRSAHLVRVRGSHGHDVIETFHDRVREVAQSKLTKDELVYHHRRLARAIESSGRRDVEALAVHYHGAGELARAAKLFAAAAEQASETLAFDRAARLYRQSISLDPSGDHLRELYARLGDALANAGRGAEAAHAYLNAAHGASGATALERKRRAAEQFLRSGHVDEGMSTLDDVLGAMGMRLAKTPQRALASLIVQRARLKVRGMSFTAHEPNDISQETLTRIDACWSVALGLGMVDVIRSSEFQTRNLLLSLDAGEPYRVARALAAEALAVATGGGASREETQRVLQKAEQISEQIDHPHALGMSMLAKGMSANLEGFWMLGRDLLERALAIFEERCTGVAWETSTSAHMALWALAYLGELAELSDRVPALLHEAKSRGDLYAATLLTTGLPNIAWLQVDEVDAARRVLAEGMGRWSQRGFHLQHYNHMLAEVHVDLYTGDGETALRRLELRWPLLSASLLLRVQQIRIEALHLRARAELAAAISSRGDERTKHLEHAEKDARAIAKEKMAWATPLASLLRAGIAALRGDTKEAIKHCEEAALNFEGADMGLYAAIARRREGELRGGEAGGELVDKANRWMSGQRIRRPERFADMLAPGVRGA